MSYLLIGPLVGVVLVVLLSFIGIIIAHAMGGNTSMAVIQVQVSAMVVLLVTVLTRLESQRSKK